MPGPLVNRSMMGPSGLPPPLPLVLVPPVGVEVAAGVGVLLPVEPFGVGVAVPVVPPGVGVPLADPACTCNGAWAESVGPLVQVCAGSTAVTTRLVFCDSNGALKVKVNVPSLLTFAVPALVAQPFVPCAP